MIYNTQIGKLSTAYKEKDKYLPFNTVRYHHKLCMYQFWFWFSTYRYYPTVNRGRFRLWFATFGESSKTFTNQVAWMWFFKSKARHFRLSFHRSEPQILQCWLKTSLCLSISLLQIIKSTRNGKLSQKLKIFRNDDDQPSVPIRTTLFSKRLPKY